MPKIIPLRELKEPSKISAMCHELNAPVFVTKNGVSDLVILTSDAYDSLCEAPKTETTEYKLKVLDEDHVDETPGLSGYMTERDKKKIYSIAELKAVLAPIFKEYNVKKAVLFGSYVKGTADTRSDVDLVVDSDLRGLAFYGLLGAVADVLRFPVDLIERRQIEQGSEIDEEIRQTGVVIYE